MTRGNSLTASSTSAITPRAARQLGRGIDETENPSLPSSYSMALSGGPVGVLLIHGLTGTPAEMRVLARGLHRAGYTVHCVQLAGHCADMASLLSTTWQDWYASVHRAAQRLAACTEKMYVGGLSMGAILALSYAADRPKQVCGVMAYSPVFEHDGWSMPVHTRFAKWVLPLMRKLHLGRDQISIEAPPYGIKDQALRRRIVEQMHAGQSADAGLSGTPWYSVVEFHRLVSCVKRQLRHIVTPCLVVHATEDDVASPRNARRIVSQVTRAPVEMVWLDDSYHMVTVDRQRRDVIAASLSFMQACERRL